MWQNAQPLKNDNFARNLNEEWVLLFERGNCIYSFYMCLGICVCFCFTLIHSPVKYRINFHIEIRFWKLYICNICNIYILKIFAWSLNLYLENLRVKCKNQQMMILQIIIEFDWLLGGWNFIYGSTTNLIKELSKIKYNYNSEFFYWQMRQTVH